MGRYTKQKKSNLMRSSRPNAFEIQMELMIEDQQLKSRTAKRKSRSRVAGSVRLTDTMVISFNMKTQKTSPSSITANTYWHPHTHTHWQLQKQWVWIEFEFFKHAVLCYAMFIHNWWSLAFMFSVINHWLQSATQVHFLYLCTIKQQFWWSTSVRLVIKNYR